MKRHYFLIAAIASLMQLNADFNWSSPPTTISTSNVDASDPSVVIDVSGNATAIWIENSVVTSSTLPNGGSWGSLNTLSGSGASNPGIGIDSSGNVIAIWLEGTVVKTAQLLFGGSWSSATTLSDTGASIPILSVNSNGDAVAVWMRNGFVESANQPSGGAWSGVSMLSASGSNNPNVSIGSDGTAVAIWQNSSNNLIYATMQIGNGWGTPVTLIADESIHNYPQIAVDSNGAATAIWYRYKLSSGNFIDVEVVASSWTSGSGWSIPTVLSNEVSYLDPANLVARLTCDNTGNVLAVWTSAAFNNSLNIESAVKPYLKGWQKGGALVLQNLYSADVSIASTPAGDSVAFYMFYDGFSLEIQSTTTDIGGIGYNFWSVPLIVSQGTNNAFPSVAVSLNGTTINGAGVWIQNNGVNNLVQASVGSKQVLTPPADPSVVQSSTDFGVVVQYYNTISWTASPDEDVIGYNLYRNGVFWNQVDAQTLSVIDQNATENGSVVYGIGTVNSAMDQSVLVTVSFP